jgi:predicted GIY-YIG superfamily endonuclease
MADVNETSHEDILKNYDLDQTLSDVMGARQTLENAYGRHSGGGSFTDHTIDEQLVELLAHMAEMNHDDAYEIEAAIKKLKKHARKLGISEGDLLFSVKSAEESALTMTGAGEDEPFSPRENIQSPHTFGDKMLDAFEGYFGRNK